MDPRVPKMRVHAISIVIVQSIISFTFVNPCIFWLTDGSKVTTEWWQSGGYRNVEHSAARWAGDIAKAAIRRWMKLVQDVANGTNEILYPAPEFGHWKLMAFIPFLFPIYVCIFGLLEYVKKILICLISKIYKSKKFTSNIYTNMIHTLLYRLHCYFSVCLTFLHVPDKSYSSFLVSTVPIITLLVLLGILVLAVVTREITLSHITTNRPSK